MRRLFTSLALLLALSTGTDTAMALGLGRVGANAVLGQPLSFTIALRLDPGESIEARCIKAEVSFGDRLLPQSLIATRVETALANGERRIRVTTSTAIDEPVATVHLQLGCSSSLSRSFTLLADPPGVAAVESSLREGWVSDQAPTPMTPVLAAVPLSVEASATSEAPRGKGTRRAGSPSPSPVIAANTSESAVPRQSGRGRANGTASAGKPRGPVLRLDPLDTDALILPQLQMETRLSMPAGAAASGSAARDVDPDIARHRAEQERLKAMEAALLKLRVDSQATQRSLDQMQQRLRAAEMARYANPLVYLLVLLCLLMAAALVVMWWLRRRDRAAAAWWAEQPADRGATSASAEALAALSVPAPTIGPAALADLAEVAPPAASVLPAAPLAPPAESSRPAEPESLAEPRRPMSAEELIDLEQQAEFFVVLGQDEAAIDLLMGHVRSTGGVSPLPYLKLLEIYRRRGEREPYDRIRERFNRRFNAYATEWDVDPEHGLSLEGYPEVLQRLQDLWERPSQAMELLDTALFRRDSGPTFDVPAYRELLFLYSTARDLAERDVGPDGVDLLLPFSGEISPPMMTSVAASRSSAARVPSPAPPASAEASASFSLDLDVSTGQTPLTLEDIDFKDQFKKKSDP